MVCELLRGGYELVIGVARSNFREPEGYSESLLFQRYRHIQGDISSRVFLSRLKAITDQLPPGPTDVVFNAAIVKSDILKGGAFDHEIFNAVNLVAIEGLGNVLTAFGSHLCTHGGRFIAISSFSALAPPIAEPRLAYPCSKAYLDMAMRCLRFIWPPHVKAVTVHLGHIGGSGETLFSSWLKPSYEMAARRIVRSMTSGKIPDTIEYPFLYSLVYKWFLRFVPDEAYFRIFRFIENLK